MCMYTQGPFWRACAPFYSVKKYIIYPILYIYPCTVFSIYCDRAALGWRFLLRCLWPLAFRLRFSFRRRRVSPVCDAGACTCNSDAPAGGWRVISQLLPRTVFGPAESDSSTFCLQMNKHISSFSNKTPEVSTGMVPGANERCGIIIVIKQMGI